MIRHHHFGNMHGFASMYDDSNTKLLIHSNTTNADTTFTDSSASSHTVTRNGDTYHSTFRKKFGTTSIIFDGTGDYLSVADHADWNFGGGAFTIDFWIYVVSLPAVRMGLFQQREDGINWFKADLQKATAEAEKAKAEAQKAIADAEKAKAEAEGIPTKVILAAKRYVKARKERPDEHHRMQFNFTRYIKRKRMSRNKFIRTAFSEAEPFLERLEQSQVYQKL